MPVLTSLLLVVAGADLLESGAAYEVSYAGRLSPVAVSDEKASSKGFEALWLLPHPADEKAEGLAVVTEDAYALPWPSRFAFSSAVGDKAGPKIGYRFGDRDYTVPLPGPIFSQAQQLEQENELIDGALRFAVTGEETIGNRTCMLIEVKTNFGRDRTLAVEKRSGLIVRYEETVFLGRGDRFQLILELDHAMPLTSEQAAARAKFADLLREITEIAQIEDRDEFQDLSAEPLVKLAGMKESLAASAKGTPFGPFATAISMNVSEQQRRLEGIEGLAKRVVGSPAPPFELVDIDGRRIDISKLKDKVVVLHFWEYDHDLIAAPYGQVGFLDFLHRKRSKSDVAVVGVAVNGAFSDPGTRAKPARSAKTLAGFMNLGFPLASDDGTLLESFGDPRPLGAGLPLWVVIDQDGIVRAYKSGLYDAGANEGLKELDSLIVKLLSESGDGQALKPN